MIFLLLFKPDKGLNVYESDFGLFGVMICADRRWPETARTLTHPGQSLITGPNGAVVCNNEDKSQTYTVTEIDLSKALADKSQHIVDRRPDVYKL